MKKFSFCLAVFAILMLIVSCGGSKKDDNTDTGDTAPDGDIVDTGDTENPDTPDTSDSEPSDDTDTSDSGPDGDTDTDDPDTDPTDTESGWKTSDKDEIILDAKGTSGQVQPKVVKTDDGKIVLTWLRAEGGEMDSSDFGYYLQITKMLKVGRFLEQILQMLQV